MDPLTVLLLRHAEKPAPETGAGVDERGQPDPASLAVRGWQRSGALVALLSGSASLDFPVPDALFTSTSLKKSRRCEQTLAALAAQQKLVLNTRYGRGEERALAECLLPSSGTHIVCWQYQMLPTLARHLLGPETLPGLPVEWPQTRFDMVWKLVRSNGGWTFAQVPQLLLAGDSDKALD